MSSIVTRQATPNSSAVDALPVNSRKRASLDDVSDVEGRNIKKLRGDITNAKKDKRKRKKKKKMPVVIGIGSTSKSNAPIIITSRSVHLMPALDLAKSSNQNSLPPSEPLLSTAMNTNVSEANSPPEPDASILVIGKLNVELATKSALIHTHENAMSQVQQNITCQICLDLLYKPYAVAPCGHIACYSCLMSWFSRPTEDGASTHQPPIYLRKKTCPHCRATVRDTPVEVWAVKNIVNSLVGTGLLIGLPPPPVSDDSGSGGETGTRTDTLKEDLWKDIFYAPRSSILSLTSREDAGIRDDEDGGVYRCVECMHEIAGGVCTHCLRIYRAHPDYDYSDDIDDDEDDAFFDAGFDEHLEEADYDHYDLEDDVYLGNVFFDFPYHRPRRVPLRRNRGVANRNEDIEITGSVGEGHEIDDMAGFIDDSEDHELAEEAQQNSDTGEVEEVDLVNLDLDYDSVAAANSSQGPTEVIEVTDEDDEDEIPTRPARRRGVNRVQNTIILLSDDEGEESEEDNAHLVPSDDDEYGEEFDSDGMNHSDGIQFVDADDPNLESSYWDNLDDENGDIYHF
ncbi:hypothetical protein J3R30DRAFT_3417748 [Lentinula aciculospora]|uniref:RING-type domain-containing protein n=1 Tax=Lentinula aciculospora TaxID=153920 RepID=A0A9W9AW22_9AGAR|nr:hypothetical protein J3R30DRAFT_3417748 [Lentinula aciculospora]